MKLHDLLQTTPESLATIQYHALKEHAVERLKVIAKLLDQDDLQGVRDFLNNSPAGDGMGSEVDYIAFDLYAHNPSSYRENDDLGSVCDKLENLQRMVDINGGAKS